MILLRSMARFAHRLALTAPVPFPLLPGARPLADTRQPHHG
ncbi:hypothetical protein ACFVVX_16270 [Kitasatospora sp. NPDC058170]